MGCANLIKRVLIAGLFAVVAVVFFSGCTKPDYKQQADEQVYNIIDQKWLEEFGSKVNYKIDDIDSLPQDVQTVKAVPESGVLTLPEAVAMATDHNREYQTQKELLYTSALDLRLERHIFENQYFGGAGFGYGKEGDDEAVGGSTNAGFSRLLSDGAFISTNIALSLVDVITGDLESGLASIFSASITKPLLRASMRKVVQENLTQAERNSLYQVRSFNRFRKTFVVSIITQYYRVLELADIAQNAKDNHDVLSRLYEQTAILAGAGRIPKEELDRVRQEKLRAWDIYLQADKDHKQLLDEYKLSLSLPTDSEFTLDQNELVKLNAALSSKPSFGPEEAISTALAQRLDLANSEDAIADAERKVVVAADNLRADLSLTASVDLVSDDIADTDRFRDLRNLGDLGLRLDLPLERTAEANIYRLTLITLSQRQREFEQAGDTVKLEVRQAYRNLTEAAERHLVQFESLALAHKRYNNTLALVRSRRASSRRVLRAQEDIFDAKNAAATTLVDYTVATLNFYRDTGVLSVRADGMWEH
ncbi:MAG: TolC family protein [Planctomycetota bacterium]|jgi:outer membrane protein TolC